MSGADRPSPRGRREGASGIVRVLNPARAAIGATRLMFPILSLPGIDAVRLGAAGRQVVRVLGARQILQAGLTGRTPSRAVLWLGAEIDAAHVLSMVGLAVCSRRYRRAALGDAAIGGTLAAAGAWAALRSPCEPGAERTPAGAWRDEMAERLAGLAVPGYPPSAEGHPSEPGRRLIIGSEAGAHG